MIPKIAKFYFYLYSDFQDGDNPLNLIQLIAHAENYVEDTSLSEGEQVFFSKRKEFCEMVFEDDWSSRNGKVQFFFEFENIEHVQSYYGRFVELAHEFGFNSEIQNLKDSLEFYIRNEREINLLSKEEGDNWWEDVQSLEKEYKSNYSLTERLAKLLRDNPSGFCRDENGGVIAPYFTGRVKYYRKNGKILHDYSVVNGRVLGKCLDFDFEGNLSEESYRDAGGRRESIKRWFPNGQIEYEKISSSDYRSWYKNGQIKNERIDGVFRKWDEDGNGLC